MKSAFLFFASAIVQFSAVAQTATPVELAGKYANRSESSFVYTLDLAKDGQATYREPDPEGGRALTLKGKWTLADGVMTVDFGKKGRYVYAPKPKLSWESFGCREATQGLEIVSTPRGKSQDPGYHVWRSEDLKRSDRCKRL